MGLICHRGIALLCFVCALFVFCSCAGLPKNINPSSSFAIAHGEDSRLGGILAPSLAEHPNQSGVHLLSNGLDAFVGRAVLAGLAERSIDVQYYMFHQDTVGKLLIDQLIKAADRGVRVRMLIDDIYGSDADDVWTALDSHPNIHVRMFNPFARGGSKNLQWITRFKDVNHRMHSKSFTVDNQFTVVGGRNIGDEYFNANAELAFADIDVLAAGPVVPQVSEAFDQYWNSTAAYPATILSGPAQAGRLEKLRSGMAAFAGNAGAAAYIDALKNSKLANALRDGHAQFKWAQAKVLHDSVEKKERKSGWQSDLLIAQLWPTIETATDEVLIISPYFIPGKKGAKALCNLCKKGVKVRILTNSLASNDVSAVHAGYAGYRKQLLRAGVELYELDEAIREKAGKNFTWLPGLEKSSLHAKTMVIDRKAMFVGSMNLDPRSLQLNNEIGILFFNREIAESSAAAFVKHIDKAAFRLSLNKAPNGHESIRWHLKRADSEIVYDSDPYTGFWKRVGVRLIGMLPVESML